MDAQELPRPKVAVIGLCKHHSAHQLVGRQESLKKHLLYPSYFQVDNIIFEDKSFSPQVREAVNNISPATFINIWENPTVNLKKSHPPFSILGYKGMCLFYAMEVFHYLKEYDYCVRLDSDSLLHSTLGLEPFVTARGTYGYIHEKVDGHCQTTATLPQAIKKYICEQHIPIKCQLKEINQKHHYSNFWLTDLEFWRKNEVQHYLAHIYSLGGIQDYRWGDHVILSNALRMFASPEKIVKLDFKYEHASHKYKNF